MITTDAKTTDAAEHPPSEAALAAPAGSAFAWFAVAANVPPEGITVMTKIDDGRGARNETPLKHHGNLWFLPDMIMYVYYSPTHWAPMPNV